MHQLTPVRSARSAAASGLRCASEVRLKPDGGPSCAPRPAPSAANLGSIVRAAASENASPAPQAHGPQSAARPVAPLSHRCTLCNYHCRRRALRCAPLPLLLLPTRPPLRLLPQRSLLLLLLRGRARAELGQSGDVPCRRAAAVPPPPHCCFQCRTACCCGSLWGLGAA